MGLETHAILLASRTARRVRTMRPTTGRGRSLHNRTIRRDSHTPGTSTDRVAGSPMEGPAPAGPRRSVAIQRFSSLRWFAPPVTSGCLRCPVFLPSPHISQSQSLPRLFSLPRSRWRRESQDMRAKSKTAHFAGKDAAACWGKEDSPAPDNWQAEFHFYRPVWGRFCP
jgi:hypothetical protein